MKNSDYLTKHNDQFCGEKQKSTKFEIFFIALYLVNESLAAIISTSSWKGTSPQIRVYNRTPSDHTVAGSQ